MHFEHVRFYGELKGKGPLEVGPGWAEIHRRGPSPALVYLAFAAMVAAGLLYYFGLIESVLAPAILVPLPFVLLIFLWPRRAKVVRMAADEFEAILGADWDEFRRILEDKAEADGFNLDEELTSAGIELDESLRVHFARHASNERPGLLRGTLRNDWLIAEFDRPEEARDCVRLFKSNAAMPDGG